MFNHITFPYDTTYIKELERHNARALMMRMGLMMACAVAGYVFLDSTVFLIWGVIYAILIVTWSMALQRVPDTIGRAGFAAVLAGSVIYGTGYIWIAWYAWGRPEPVLHYAAFIAVIGAMLNSVSVRSDDTIMSLSDIILAILTAGWMVFSYHGRDDVSGRDTLFFAVLMGALTVYLFNSIKDANMARTKLRNSQRAEVEQAKLQALGQLTGGVAHDFNNLLTVIIGNLELRREADLDREDEEELLGEVDAAARKASVLTSHLLAFSRRSPLETQIVDVRVVVDSARVLLHRLMPVTHSLAVHSNDALPQIEVDVGKLETVIVNLVMNARDAMPSGGHISVQVREHDLPDGPPIPHASGPCAGSSLKAGHYVELSIEDDGMGIPAKILNSVLEPYFTTKPVGKGSGLGLSMALGFAEQSGGTLSIESEEGIGTKVSLWFPTKVP